MIYAFLVLAGVAQADENVLLKRFGMDLPNGLAELPGRRLDGHLILRLAGEDHPSGVPWMHAGYGRLDPGWDFPGRQRVTPPRCTGFEVVGRQEITIDGLPAQLVLAEAVLVDGGAPVLVFDAVAYDRHKQPLFVVEAVVPAEERGYWLAQLSDSVGSIDLAISSAGTW